MANNSIVTTSKRGTVTAKPLQRISSSAKYSRSSLYFKDTADYYISRNTAVKGNIKELYDVYNNRFPVKWFKHIMDPLSAKKKEHRNFSARMRPTGILRTNLDLLMGEYPRRPFVYQVTNLGEDGYNAYTAALQKNLQGNLSQHFIAGVMQQAAEAGTPVEQMPDPGEIQMPDSFVKKFKSTYKDNIAIKAQKWLKRAIKEFGIRQEQFKMFKDYLITGYCYSYKSVERSSLVYERVPVSELTYDQNDGNEYLEDKEWIVRSRYMNFSDIVDNYYDELKNSDLNDIEKGNLGSPSDFYGYMSGSTMGGVSVNSEMWEVKHVVWTGKKKILVISYPDPMTGEMQEEIHDEDYIINEALGESSVAMWVNEKHEATRIGRDIYIRMRPVPIQRNAMNNHSTCKGPYNGRSFSNTESDNISIMEIGLPFQLMHMIIGYILEKTIAKSKGKILMMDRNAIPRDNGWDEEKFFYYSDALGYALMDRNQLGVDKTMNQYHVLDMTQFDSIAQLINLQTQVKQMWDDVLGITRQRKGQTYASDSVTNNQSATFQSTVITDSIFSSFEEYMEKDYQGLLDLSKFTNIDGVRKIYNNDDFDLELLEIDPHEYTNADLGIYFVSSVKEQERFEAFRNNLQAMTQNGTKNSTVLDILMSDSVAELKQKLIQVEDIEAQMQQQQEEEKGKQGQAMQEQAEEHEKMMAEYMNTLKKDLMNLEWDRRDENKMIEGEYTLAAGDSASVNAGGELTGAPDQAAMDKNINERMKSLSAERLAREQQINENARQVRELTFKYDEMSSKERMNTANNKTAIANKVVGEKSKPKPKK